MYSLLHFEYHRARQAKRRAFFYVGSDTDDEESVMPDREDKAIIEARRLFNLSEVYRNLDSPLSRILEAKRKSQFYDGLPQSENSDSDKAYASPIPQNLKKNGKKSCTGWSVRYKKRGLPWGTSNDLKDVVGSNKGHESGLNPASTAFQTTKGPSVCFDPAGDTKERDQVHQVNENLLRYNVQSVEPCNPWVKLEPYMMCASFHSSNVPRSKPPSVSVPTKYGLTPGIHTPSTSNGGLWGKKRPKTNKQRLSYFMVDIPEMTELDETWTSDHHQGYKHESGYGTSAETIELLSHSPVRPSPEWNPVVIRALNDNYERNCEPDASGTDYPVQPSNNDQDPDPPNQDSKPISGANNAVETPDASPHQTGRSETMINAGIIIFFVGMFAILVFLSLTYPGGYNNNNAHIRHFITQRH